MDWKDVGKLIKKSAPILGTVFTGNIPSAISAAGALLADKFGGDPDNPNELYERLNNDPETLLKLKEIESENSIELRRLAIAEAEVYATDVRNARSREIQLTKIRGKTDRNLTLIAWAVIVGFLGLTGALTFTGVPEASTDVIYMLYGALATGFGGILNYYFGSSRGSKDKTDILKNGAK
jgi:hypothetical protein